MAGACAKFDKGVSQDNVRDLIGKGSPRGEWSGYRRPLIRKSADDDRTCSIDRSIEYLVDVATAHEGGY